MDELRAFGGPLHLRRVAIGRDRNPMRVEIDPARQSIWVYTARTVVVADVSWRVLAPRQLSDAQVSGLIAEWIGLQEQSTGTDHQGSASPAA